MADIQTVNVTDQRAEMNEKGIEVFRCELTVVLKDGRSHIMNIESETPIESWS